jgi:hypothetical protein
MKDTNREQRKEAIAFAKISSSVVVRLIKEVTDGVEIRAAAYNRSYNRHNR